MEDERVYRLINAGVDAEFAGKIAKDVTRVELFNCSMQPDICYTIFPLFVNLTVVAISRVHFSEDEITALAILIANPATRITHLTLDRCNLESIDAIILFGALRTNTALDSLCTENNCFDTDAAFRVLSDVLKVNTTLQCLDFEACYVGNKELMCLLENLRPMRELRLSDNCIGDEGFKALVEMVATTKTLQVLRFDANMFGHTHEHLMVDALNRNSSLLEFALGDWEDGNDDEEVRRNLRIAPSRACARTRLLAFLGAYAPKNRDRVPAFGFLKRDGDFAIAHRVWEFMTS